MNLITLVWIIVTITCFYKLFVVFTNIFVFWDGHMHFLRFWVIPWHLSDHVFKTSLLWNLNLFGINVCFIAAQCERIVFFCDCGRSFAIVVRAPKLVSSFQFICVNILGFIKRLSSGVQWVNLWRWASHTFTITRWSTWVDIFWPTVCELENVCTVTIASCDIYCAYSKTKLACPILCIHIALINPCTGCSESIWC